MPRLVNAILLVALSLLLSSRSGFNDVCASRQKPQSRIIFQLLSVDNCSGKPGHFEIKNSSAVRTSKGDNLINCAMENYGEAKLLSRLDISITACRDGISHNTCESFSAWKFPAGVCTLATSDNTPWASVIKAIRPPFRCPFKAGKYTLANGTVNVDAIIRIAGSQIDLLMNRIWVPELRVYNEKQDLHICFKVSCSFARSRIQ
ncbi:uncharacterized protein LOC117652538 [Thrips palmi]|uniref:Uncharacterized protein LOC117652538 n=1 Tax=Thrips palmi TaxID=161013 RepID=A0A6P9A7A9_THRPL|nr:uncharacterized protein LOC117652538 [Thrips palmi]